MAMKWLSGVVLAGLAVLGLTSVALAGGWAVTTLDALPGGMHAGQSYRIGYVIRQHGVTPVTFAEPRVRISLAGAELTFAGVRQGAPGHYVSDVTFPRAGAWTWVVDQTPFPEPQKLGEITVQAAPIATPDPIPALKPQPPVELAMVALVAMLLGAVALAIVQVKRVARPAATTATAQTASILTHARRSTPTPSRS